MADPTSVLVIRLSSLGDVLFAVPAVQALAEAPHVGRVGLLVEDRAASLVTDLVPIDDLVVFPRRRPSRWPAHAAALLRRRDDVVLDLQSNLKSRLQRALLRSPRSVGFDAPWAREGGQAGLDERFVPAPDVRHRVEANVAILARLGVTPPAVIARPRLAPSDAHRDAAARELSAFGGAHGPLVVLHPGTSSFGRLKRWAAARFAALGDRLARELGARVAVSGGPAEGDLVDAVRGAAATGLHVLPPRGLGVLGAILEVADLVVAADSLPLHLANALGTPVVGLYGPKDSRRTGPYWDRSTVVRSGVACSPCTLRRCDDVVCMERLGVDTVMAACRRMLLPPTERVP